MTSPNNNSCTKIWTLLPWLLGAIFLFAPIVQPVFAGAKDVQPTVSPREAVEQFCRAEFDGHNERYDNARLTPEYKASKRQQGYDFGGGINLWDWDPYVIVTSYEILSVSVKGKKGTASVAYRRVGSSDGKERIVPETPRQEVVSFSLSFDGKRWWVVDPPLPRISKEDLLLFYEQTIERFQSKDWLERPDITEQQKESFRETLKAQETLKSLHD